MGRAKAWLPWFGRTMIEHVVHRLGSAVDEVVVVTSKQLELPSLDALIVKDREVGLGPLAGIRDGLRAAASDLAFVTSADAPFLTPEFVEEMLDHGVPVAPRADGHVQVLSAVYPGSAWKEAEALLSHGTKRPLALLEYLGFEAIDWDSGDAPAPWQGFNTPAEYLAGARTARPDAVAQVELLGRAAQGLDSSRFKVPIGTLGEVLADLPLPDSLRLVDGVRLAEPYLVSLGGRDLVRNLDLPVGPGERVSVIDAPTGES
jgi:molybdopterin-guanine dinucleotide biosynthesis protein A